MMTNKYYTPEIEEFRVGFEYEFQDGGEWMKLKWNADVTIIGRLLEPIVRVKYLDKQDIESCGFEFKNKIDQYEEFEKHEFNLRLYSTEHIYIYRGGFVMFDGILKNKSELKKLLKQLGI